MQSCRIRVTGVVQGVGFRPFVWRLANELSLDGWVRNDAAGVEIAAQGAATQVEALMRRLRAEAPSPARVDMVEAHPALPEPLAGFRIAASAPGAPTTMIGADLATCPQCLAELFDPVGRRWRHPFITCTHCGPRYTITRSLPYDRPRTSMARFSMCPACAAEYGTPADRRFHAEPTCCPECGPRLALRRMDGQCVEGDAIAGALAILQRGGILAVKALGGFHLACDARDAVAVARLRERKNREAKPFAVMAANVESLCGLAEVSAHESELLGSAQRPVVVLDATGSDPLPGVSPGLATLGVMLPLTPVQWLLFHEAAGRPAGTGWLREPHALLLVMTSANPGGEPIVQDGAEARERLGGIADFVLDHDREIVARCDDSVLRSTGRAPVFLRRSRGYAPGAVRLARGGASVLAFGAHLKNTLCVTRGSQAFLSPHVGDLDNAATCAFQSETATRLQGLLGVRPAIVAHDLQPDDRATQAAQAFAAEHDLPALAVQHHHAHIAAVCAEHAQEGPVLGLALDGAGYGSDGGAWGGELLRVEGASFERLGHLRELPLPGGDRAARQPWRMAAAALHALGRGGEITQRFAGEPQAAGVAAMLERGLHAPPTSSMGRVFDAAAGLLGLCAHMQYEAQAAMLLEQAAWAGARRNGWPPPGEARASAAGGTLDLRPLLAALVDAADAPAAAAGFHVALAESLAEWVAQQARKQGLRNVALSGGCLANRLLARSLAHGLELRGLSALLPQAVPCGDGAIALGQAWVALHVAGKD